MINLPNLTQLIVESGFELNGALSRVHVLNHHTVARRKKTANNTFKCCRVTSLKQDGYFWHNVINLWIEISVSYLWKLYFKEAPSPPRPLSYSSVRIPFWSRHFLYDLCSALNGQVWNELLSCMLYVKFIHFILLYYTISFDKDINWKREKWWDLLFRFYNWEQRGRGKWPKWIRKFSWETYCHSCSL